MLAPILSFTCEEVWQAIGVSQSIHLESWPKPIQKNRDAFLEEKWGRFLEIREKVLKALEEKREKKEIGNSLEAEVELTFAKKDDYDFLKNFKGEAASFFLVSSVACALAEQTISEPLVVRVSRAGGLKCERCWNWRSSVGRSAAHPTLCERCVKVLNGEF
jgi:isoleucyl-tRNA synthetase